MLNKFWFLFIIFFLVSSSYAEAVRLGDGIKVGNRQMDFKIEFGGGHDSNILLTESDEIDDSYYFLFPNLDFEWKGPSDRRFSLSAEGDLKWYSSYSEENTQAMVGQGVLEDILGDLLLRLSYDWLDFSAREGLLSGDLLDYSYHGPGLFLDWNLNLFSIELEFKKNFYGYDDEGFNIFDHDRNEVDLFGVWHFASQTDLFVQGSYHEFDYDMSERSGDASLGYLGIRGKLFSKLEGLAKVGYQKRDYEQNFSKRYDDINWNLNLTFKPIEAWRLMLDYKKDVEESLLSEYNYYDLNQFHFQSKLDTYRGYFLHLDFFWERQEFPEIDALTVSREDDVLRFNARVGFDSKKWWEVFLNFLYEERDSNREGLSYTRNQVEAGFSLTL